MMSRPDGRRPDELRPVRIERRVLGHAEGSALISCGDTRVLCTASLERGVPRFMRGHKRGWLTAEYGMLPRATKERNARETNGPGGRTREIQRLIGRTLRNAVDLRALGEQTLIIDCDVLQADGGTRTAAITGAALALADALEQVGEGLLRSQVAAVSVGLVGGAPLLDLNYAEDSRADVDMNVVMDDRGRLLEVQGTAERSGFSRAQLDAMLGLAESGIAQLQNVQREALDG